MGLLLLAGAAACDRVPRDPVEASGPSAKEKAALAEDTAKLEERLRIANLEKRMDAAEAQLAVGPTTREHLELDLLKARLDKIETDVAADAEATKAAGAAALRAAAKPAK